MNEIQIVLDNRREKKSPQNLLSVKRRKCEPEKSKGIRRDVRRYVRIGRDEDGHVECNVFVRET